jgi:hypothetical protein
MTSEGHQGETMNREQREMVAQAERETIFELKLKAQYGASEQPLPQPMPRDRFRWTEPLELVSKN